MALKLLRLHRFGYVLLMYYSWYSLMMCVELYECVCSISIDYYSTVPIEMADTIAEVPYC